MMDSNCHLPTGAKVSSGSRDLTALDMCLVGRRFNLIRYRFERRIEDQVSPSNMGRAFGSSDWTTHGTPSRRYACLASRRESGLGAHVLLSLPRYGTYGTAGTATAGCGDGSNRRQETLVRRSR